MKKTIPEIMLRDHSRIHNIIQELKKAKPEDAQRLFIKFKWNLEKHFYIEEKVVFQIYLNSLNEETEELDKLLSEHKDMLFLIKKIDNHFHNSANLLSQLDSILTAHAQFEDEIFYPRLEEELSENEKNLIADRCEDWV